MVRGPAVFAVGTVRVFRPADATALGGAAAFTVGAADVSGALAIDGAGTFLESSLTAASPTQSKQLPPPITPMATKTISTMRRTFVSLLGGGGPP
jgi:hypothetical protein